MATEATTSVRARTADGRFASKATGAAVVAPMAVAVPENVPELTKGVKKADAKKHAKKADSKKADAKKHAKKADSKKADAKKHAKKTDSKKTSKKAKSKSGGKKKAKSKSGGKKK